MVFGKKMISHPSTAQCKYINNIQIKKVTHVFLLKIIVVCLQNGLPDIAPLNSLQYHRHAEITAIINIKDQPLGWSFFIYTYSFKKRRGTSKSFITLV